MITLGLASYPLETKPLIEVPDGVRTISTPLTTQLHKKIALIDTRTQNVVMNGDTWVWCKGSAFNTPFGVPENGEDSEDSEVIRSWPEEHGDRARFIFGSQLDPDKDYLVVAIPCEGMIQFDEAPTAY